MNRKSANFIIMFFSAVVAGQAAHYFISGDSSTGSTVRTILVAAQLVIAVALLIWAWKRYQASSKSPEEKKS
jgi:protein-S-isoprenylcysteine O-methyltransferase Ste14